MRRVTTQRAYAPYQTSVFRTRVASVDLRRLEGRTIELASDDLTAAAGRQTTDPPVSNEPDTQSVLDDWETQFASVGFSVLAVLEELLDSSGIYDQEHRDYAGKLLGDRFGVVVGDAPHPSSEAALAELSELVSDLEQVWKGRYGDTFVWPVGSSGADADAD